MNPNNNEELVRFFNNYRYTVYIPTNESIKEARENGLMTYNEIIEYMEEHIKSGDNLTDEDLAQNEVEQVKVQAMITMLMNFLKYHFQDQSLFVDNVTSDESYQTSCIDNVKNVYLTLRAVQSDGALTVYDETGVGKKVLDINNIMARDADFDKAVANNALSIRNSSFVVLHQIEKPLLFKKELKDERFDAEWATPAKANAFVKKYRIK